MTDEEFNEMMAESLAQAKAGQGENMEIVFDRLEKMLEHQAGSTEQPKKELGF
ncbi:MAG: hypothetical protein NC084_07305 [Bacteroides sp.]|nr:hypothetical protein [Eubacterium sp.]MCM1418487.1 hypothetical protein [Roseburia sp.]MCM1462506.1 hypothetical protein [Bacteroides sp.]